MDRRPGRVVDDEPVLAFRRRRQSRTGIVADVDLVLDGLPGPVHTLRRRAPDAQMAVPRTAPGRDLLARRAPGVDREIVFQRQQREIIAAPHVNRQRLLTALPGAVELGVETPAAREQHDALCIGRALRQNLVAAEDRHLRVGHHLPVIQARHPDQTVGVTQLDVNLERRELCEEAARVTGVRLRSQLAADGAAVATDHPAHIERHCEREVAHRLDGDAVLEIAAAPLRVDTRVSRHDGLEIGHDGRHLRIETGLQHRVVMLEHQRRPACTGGELDLAAARQRALEAVGQVGVETQAVAALGGERERQPHPVDLTGSMAPGNRARIAGIDPGVVVGILRQRRGRFDRQVLAQRRDRHRRAEHQLDAVERRATGRGNARCEATFGLAYLAGQAEPARFRKGVERGRVVLRLTGLRALGGDQTGTDLQVHRAVGRQGLARPQPPQFARLALRRVERRRRVEQVRSDLDRATETQCLHHRCGRHRLIEAQLQFRLRRRTPGRHAGIQQPRPLGDERVCDGLAQHRAVECRRSGVDVDPIGRCRLQAVAIGQVAGQELRIEPAPAAAGTGRHARGHLVGAPLHAPQRHHRPVEGDDDLTLTAHIVARGRDAGDAQIRGVGGDGEQAGEQHEHLSHGAPGCGHRARRSRRRRGESVADPAARARPDCARPPRWAAGPAGRAAAAPGNRAGSVRTESRS